MRFRWTKSSAQTKLLIAVLVVVLSGVILYRSSVSQQSLNGNSVTTSTSPHLLPIPPWDITGYHSGIPEVHNPSDAEMGSNCRDVTSYDYDWDDDMYCERSDGSSFYTNYSGANAVER